MFENAEIGSHMDFEEMPRRSKRASGFGPNNCSPGWTGGACEFPICSETNYHDHEPQPPAKREFVDIFYARNAQQSFYIYVDNTMHGQEIQLQSDSGPINPKLILIDSNGTIYNPSEEQNAPNSALYTWQFLPVQTYKIQLMADDPAGSMIVLFAAYTYLSTEIGGFTYKFLDDYALHNDTPSYQFFTQTPTVFVAAPIGLEAPGSLATVSFFSDSVPAPHNLRLDLRYGCHYRYYTSAFTCGAEGNFYARVRGYDFYGHTFVRLHSFVCEIPLPTSPPPTQPTTTGTGSPPPVRCMNGGATITRPNGTTCFCNGLFTGPYCGTPLCMNNGDQRGGICICPSGFSGSHCQNVQCEDNALAGSRIGTPMLTFVIRVRQSMASIISQVSGAVSQIVNDLNYDPAYVSRFGLVTYNNNDSSVFSFNRPQDLIAKLNTLATTTDTSGGCIDIGFESVYTALNEFLITNKAPIYVITDAEPFDSEDYIQGIMNVNSYYQSPIHFLFVQPQPNSGCGGMDLGSHPFVEMSLIAQRFAGLATLITPALQSSFQQFLYTHLSHTYHKAHLIFSDDQYQCTNLPKYIPISVEVQFHELVVILEGNITSVQLNSPEGDTTQFTGQLLYGSTNIYWLTGLQTGTWTLTVVPTTGRNGCFARVYAVEDPTPQTINGDYHLVWGITPDLNLDAPERQPLIASRQSVVAHIENFRVDNPWELNAEIVVYTDGASNAQGRDFVMASNGVWRSGCSYEIYFPPFRCFTEGLNMYFTIFVRDRMGNAIQRSGVFFCVAYHPTPNPQPGECVNGGISYNNTCICPPQWTGPNCQNRVCFNNGTLSSSGFCQCPPGTGGEFCQFLRCISPNTRPNFGQLNRHMVFILDVTRNNAVALSDLATHVAEVVRDIASQNRNWITRYFVYGADSQKVYRIGDTGNDNLGHVQDFFNTALQMSTNASADTSCSIKIFEAIREGMNFFNDRSYITVFTSAAPDESNALNSTLPAYNAVLRGHHMLNVFAAATAPGQFSCGQPVDYQLLSDLADVTTGRLLGILKTEFYLAMKVIPTWFSSSMIYKKTFADCSNNATIFAPIDSFTQSIQVYINGQGAGSSGFSIMTPNGTEYDNVGSILNDNNNQLGIYDLRRPCDEGWEGMGPNVPYCFSAFYDYKSWDDARAICSDNGGFLVDDMTQSKDQWLNTYSAGKRVWIGLNSKNGSYYWDRGVGVPQDSFNGSTYSNWYNGDSSVDPQRPCVYRDTDGKWHKDSCSTPTFYVCQKHLYSSEYQPNNINDDDLPGGRWMFSFKAQGQCTLEVRVQSSIMVYTGFTTHLLEDYPFEAGVSGSTDNRLISHLEGIATPSHIPFLRFAHIMDPVNGTLYRAATFQYRTNCAYEYLSQTFICPNTSSNTNRFEVMTIGEDEFGLPFQRVTSAICEAPRTLCDNGGLVYNGLCVCDQYWQGQYCEVPRCVNGGLLNTADNTCQCPMGYRGRACQYDVCYNNANITFSPDGKAFVLVVEATTQNQNAVRDFGNQLNDILNGVASTWFTSYILVTFDRNGVTNTQTSTSIGDFVSKYNSATSSLSSNNDCSLPIFSALNTALNAANIPGNSVIYLITTGGSSPSDQQQIGNYWNTASTSDAQLFYLLIKSDQCSTEVTDPNSVIVTDIAVGTDGNILHVSDNNVGRLAKQHLPSLYNGTVIGTPTLTNNNTYSCNNLVFYMSVGQAVSKVFLYTWTTNTFPVVTGPDGNTVQITTTHIDQNSAFSFFIPPQQGIYTLKMSDVSPCMLQARIQGGAEIYPGFIAVPSDRPDVGNHLDNATSVPIFGTMNLLVAGVLNDMVELQYASLYSPERSSGEIQYIQMYYREGCSYNYYSDPFYCDRPGYFVTYFGLGSGGQPFARASYTKCLGYDPNATTTSRTTPGQTTTTTRTTPTVTGTTPTVPTSMSTTSYGYANVPADIVLILDGSSAISTSQANDIVSILTNTFQQFTIDQNYLNFAIYLTLGDDFPVALLTNGFKSIVTTQGLSNALTTAYASQELDNSPGQTIALPYAINQLSTPNFLGTGYRNSSLLPSNNHLAMYITTSSSPNQDAIDAAQTIMQQNLFQFMALAYQSNGSNNGTLTSLVGGNPDCVIISGSQSEISTKIATKVWDANFNGGNYC